MVPAPDSFPDGPGWPAVRDGVAHDEGWPLYLARYANLFVEDN
ncbi:hypothetical protein [Micromonospora sp. 050-3]